MKKRGKHNLSHKVLMTGDMGKLYPVSCVPALPGDTFQQNTAAVVRLSPLLAPVMHKIDVRIHHFFCPMRKVWDKGGETNGTFEDFITGGPDGNNANTPPTITTTGTANDLLDYMGIPLVAGIDINACPVRAFNLCFNEFYRDQDLVSPRDLDDLTVPNIAWGKDYFTAARPTPQKGDDVVLPLGTRAPVKGIGAITQTYGAGGTNIYETDGSAANTYANDNASWVSSTGLRYEEDPNNAGFPNIWADLSSATGADIRDIRRAFAIQRYKEARSRYGSRYVEYLKYLGVTPQDGRLDRPEYLSGGTVPLSISEVLSTNDNSSALFAGTMRGHGIAAMRSNKYRRFIDEHGYILTMFSVRPKGQYMDGIHREWLKTDKEDFWQEELEQIGQQEIYLNELYADITDGGTVFGYVDRYREYREHPSYVTSDFRSTFDYWHLARSFGAKPVLNSSFVECNPSKRIHAVQNEHVLWCMIHNSIAARRLVSNNAKARVL